MAIKGSPKVNRILKKRSVKKCVAFTLERVRKENTVFPTFPNGYQDGVTSPTVFGSETLPVSQVSVTTRVSRSRTSSHREKLTHSIIIVKHLCLGQLIFWTTVAYEKSNIKTFIHFFSDIKQCVLLWSVIVMVSDGVHYNGKIILVWFCILELRTAMNKKDPSEITDAMTKIFSNNYHHSRLQQDVAEATKVRMVVCKIRLQHINRPKYKYNVLNLTSHSMAVIYSEITLIILPLRTVFQLHI